MRISPNSAFRNPQFAILIGTGALIELRIAELA